MARLGRVDEEGGRAGRGEGRRDLARDMPRLADAGHDDAAARGRDDLDRLGECGAKAAFASFPERLLERVEALALGGDGAERRKDGAGLLLNHGAAVYHSPAELENGGGVFGRAPESDEPALTPAKGAACAA